MYHTSQQSNIKFCGSIELLITIAGGGGKGKVGGERGGGTHQKHLVNNAWVYSVMCQSVMFQWNTPHICLDPDEGLIKKCQSWYLVKNCHVNCLHINYIKHHQRTTVCTVLQCHVTHEFYNKCTSLHGSKNKAAGVNRYIL